MPALDSLNAHTSATQKKIYIILRCKVDASATGLSVAALGVTTMMQRYRQELWTPWFPTVTNFLPAKKFDIFAITMHHTPFHIASSAGAAGVSVAFPDMFHIRPNSIKFHRTCLRNTMSNICHIPSCLFLKFWLRTQERLKKKSLHYAVKKMMPRLLESQSWPSE